MPKNHSPLPSIRNRRLDASIKVSKHAVSDAADLAKDPRSDGSFAKSITVRLRRFTGITYGVGNQVLFLITVWYLFWFLRDGAISQSFSRDVLSFESYGFGRAPRRK